MTVAVVDRGVRTTFDATSRVGQGRVPKGNREGRRARPFL